MLINDNKIISTDLFLTRFDIIKHGNLKPEECYRDKGQAK